MSTRSRKVLAIVVVLLVLALVIPISNLVLGSKPNRLTELKSGDPALTTAAAVLGTKCANCHSGDAALPFYANLPLAKGLIQNDIETGKRYVDYAAALEQPDGKPAPEVVLAKTEYTVTTGSMPPTRYIALHWNGGLNEKDREALLSWIRETRKNNYATDGPDSPSAEEKVQPLPVSVAVDERKAALGEKLFHDVRLSKDNTISCASCHDLAKGGTDQKQFSEGVGKAVGGINAPTVFNSGFQFIQFWDGRAATLKDQADGPVNNPIEMASNWTEAAAKLQQDAEFTQAFLAVYPEGYTKDTCTEAIAEFEKTLVTPSRFDEFLRGKADALTADEKEGYELFKSQGCATCHVGELLGGQSFELMGRKDDYFGHRGNVGEADNGRFNHTKDEADKHKFKTPTLRNIAITFPYFHDGSTSDLAEAVNTMAKYQMGTTLSENDTKQIVAFLNALTGTYKGQPLAPAAG